MKPAPLQRAARLALVPVACLVAFSACAPADPFRGPTIARVEAAEDPAMLFHRLDTNGDGFLSRAELAPLGLDRVPAPASPDTVAAAFRQLDRDGDGFLTRHEAAPMLQQHPHGATFEQLDLNRDGFLSLAEASPRLQMLHSPTGNLAFDTYDRDRDGFLSRAEAEPLLRAYIASGGQTPVAALPPPVGATGLTFDQLDTNRDGFLSRAEAAPLVSPEGFDRHDLNRDGFLSRAEAQPLLTRPVGPAPRY